MAPVPVVEYSLEAFRSLLKRFSDISDAALDFKLKSGFFEEYFANLGVRTVVVECGYIDHDYLEDYAAYYVKCFTKYERNCTRLHFFKDSFSEQTFSSFLRGADSNLTAQFLQAGYAGFMVIRPLPRSVIGRTSLETYDSDSGRRRFPSLLPSHSNLFGVSFKTQTVPFQEQDQVTAACATSALWSAFQATGRMFQHRLPSPVEITRAATSNMPLRSRAFPNTDGLTIEQMAHAIRDVGLEPYYIAAQDEHVFRAAIYSYVSAGIPALIVFRLSHWDGKERVVLGAHAAAVTGFSIRSAPTPPTPEANYEGPKYVSQQLDKLYAHDDQVGPHARMQFMREGDKWFLSTSFGLGSYTDVRAEPIAVLLPLYHKIRLPFSRVSGDVVSMDRVLSGVREAVPSLGSRVEWDLRLTTVNQLKTSLFGSQTIGPSREEILTQELPRFIWHATATAVMSKTLLLDVLFDATDIDSGRYICRFDVHDETLRAVLDVVEQSQTTELGRHLAGFLAKRSPKPGT